MKSKNMHEEENFTDKNAEEGLGEVINSDDSVSGKVSEEMIDAPTGGKVEDELKEQRDKYLRLAAEYDNYRRRTAREKNELIETGGKDLIVSLLAVLDDMERAESGMSKSEDVEGLRTGLDLVFSKLRTVLEQKGLKKMNLLNKDFDPELAEAITEIPAGSPEMEGKVMDVILQGYTLNDRIIRYAKVVVGK